MSNIMLEMLDEAVEAVEYISVLEDPEQELIDLKALLASIKSELIDYMFTCGDEDGEIDTLEDDDDQKRNDALKRGQLMEDNGGPYDNPNE